MFEEFIQIAPRLCGERLESSEQPADEKEFPDIRSKSVSGQRVGVELAEWLNEKEIAASMQQDRQEESIVRALGDYGANQTKHIDSVWLRINQGASVTAGDSAAFRDELLTVIEKRIRADRTSDIGGAGGSCLAMTLPPITSTSALPQGRKAMAET